MRSRAGSARPGGWRATRSAARSFSRPRCRCILRCWATTNTACLVRAPVSSLASTTRCVAWRTKTASICSPSTSARPATASPRGTTLALWHRSKQEIAPPAAPLYGDLVGRLLAAKQGRSFKCLVLDLDNTMWGGVIGDDGMEGIALGQGSPLGEAYVAFQDYARELSPPRRHPRRMLQERRSQRRGAVREASRDGAAARRHRLLCRQLVGQGRQHPRHRRGAEHRPRFAGVHRRQPVRAQPGAAGTADGGGAGGVRRPDLLSRARSPMRGISRACRSPTRTASAPRNTRATRRATR